MDALLISIEEAARRLGLGHSKVWELVGAGDIPSIKVGRRRLVEPRALEDWVARMAASSASRV